MKSVKILSLAFGLILLVSAGAFAQTSMTTTFANIPIAPNAQTGAVGEVAFSPLVNGTIPAGESITVTYGAPISSISDLQIFVLGCNTNLALTIGTPATCTQVGTNPVVSVTANVSTKPAGTIVLSFSGNAGAVVATAPLSLFIRITGVRVDVNALGAAPGAVINATVTNSTGLGTITNNLVPVATVTEPISITAPTTFSAVAVTGGTSSGNLVINELFANAFETKGATNPTQILVSLSNIPAGFTFNSTKFTTDFGGFTAAAPATSSTGVTYYISNITATGFQINIVSQNSQSLDKIDITGGLALPFTATAPVATTPGSITVSATLAPPVTTQVAPYTVSATVLNSPLRYASRLVSVTATIGATTFNKTVLYAVFNVWIPGYNTGFAIANPTGVVRTAPATYFFGTSAVAQPGTVKVVLVPADGSAVKTVTTSDTVKPGLGLNSIGQVPAGGTWSVLLSEIAAAAGLTSFQGQVFFETNFNNAHGINFIADPLFSVQSHGYPMLVIADSPGFDN